jgi:hypothetical protein
VTLGFVDGLLPEGVHELSWRELVSLCAFTPWRVTLTEGLGRGALALAEAGCTTLWVDGSYVTQKAEPSDFDACWDSDGVDRALLDPVLLLFGNHRALQKAKYFGEFFPNVVEAGTGFLFRDFFQIDKTSGGRKGIIELDLRTFSS